MIDSLVGAHRHLYPLYAVRIELLGPTVQLKLDLYCVFSADFSANYQHILQELFASPATTTLTISGNLSEHFKIRTFDIK